MLCGWEGNYRPGGKQWQPTAGWMTYSHLGAVHRDQLQAQYLVTSMGSLFVGCLQDFVLSLLVIWYSVLSLKLLDMMSICGQIGENFWIIGLCCVMAIVDWYRMLFLLLCLELFVCLLVTFMSHAKMAEPSKRPFWGLTLMGPRNHILDGSRDPPWEGAIFWGVVWPTEKRWESVL